MKECRNFDDQLRCAINESAINERIDIKIYECIDSTNNEAKRYAASASSRVPVLFVAKEQSAGRGRVGRSFISRRNRGIYMTLLCFADDMRDTVSVTTHAAVAVATSLEKVTDKPMLIKWVNDIFDENGKVSGILVECQPTEIGYALAIGIGINVGKPDFPEELQGIASSAENVGAFDEKLIALIVEKLIAHAKSPDDKSFMQEYRARFMLDGKRVVLTMADESEKHGRVLGVDDEGGLIIDCDGKTEIIRSGSVSVRIREEQ